jgi:hypothetical protein
VLRLNGRPFAQGRARFTDSATGSTELTAKIFVKLRLPQGLLILGQIDTGAAWSILPPDLAADLGIEGEDGTDIKLSTRRGSIRCRQSRVPITLVADEGESLKFEATLAIPLDHWPADEMFLGYTGTLERIRFAVDPANNFFYFGAPES